VLRASIPTSARKAPSAGPPSPDAAIRAA
jgi:hypothetical protein